MNFEKSYQAPYRKIKKIYKFLEDFNLIDIVLPHNSDICNIGENLLNQVNNPNMYLFILESLSLGILMTEHFAHDFGYIRGLIEHDTYTIHKNYKVKIIHISKEWDTSKFNTDKLRMLYYNWNTYIIHRSIDEIRQLPEFQNIKIDLNFLETFSWSPLHIESKHNNESMNI